MAYNFYPGYKFCICYHCLLDCGSTGTTLFFVSDLNMHVPLEESEVGLITAVYLFIYILFEIQAQVKKACQELCSLEILLDDIKDIDFPPLLDLFMELDSSEIQAIDVHNESLCVLNGEYALSLMRVINQKLRRVDLQDLSFGKNFLRYIFMLSLHSILVFHCKYLCFLFATYLRNNKTMRFYDFSLLIFQSI